MDEKQETKKCCICKRDIIGYGHNAMPLAEGRCCDECNIKYVVQLRIRLLAGKTR